MTHTLDHDGCKLAYDVRGSGPSVLFIQGVGVQGYGWKPQIDDLAGQFTCISFDNRGLGRSQPLGGPLTVERMADDAAAILAAEGLTSAHVVGHSLGGLVAQSLAIKHRQQVKSLALLCTFANGRAVAPLTARMIWYGLQMKLGTKAMRARGFLKFVLPPDGASTVGAAEIAELFGHDLVTLPPIVPLQLKAMRAVDATPRLSELAGLPTLVMSAVHDPLAPPSLGRRIAEGIPGARFEEFIDASHGLPITHAAKVNALLSQFWSAV